MISGPAPPKETVKLRGGFKVPTLRNVALTAPYMHSGRFATLEEAAEFYSKGRGHAVPKGEKLLLHWHIWEPKLSAEENQQIAAFLQTLTDQSLTPQLPQQLPSGLALPVEVQPAGAAAKQQTTAWTPTSHCADTHFRAATWTPTPNNTARTPTSGLRGHPLQTTNPLLRGHPLQTTYQTGLQRGHPRQTTNPLALRGHPLQTTYQTGL